MAAFFLFVLAVAGGVVVADLVWGNTTARQVTVLHHTVSGYPEGRLRRGLEHQAVAPKPDHARLLDEFFGPEEPSSHLGGPARPAGLTTKGQERQADDHQRWVT